MRANENYQKIIIIDLAILGCKTINKMGSNCCTCLLCTFNLEYFTKFYKLNHLKTVLINYFPNIYISVNNSQ